MTRAAGTHYEDLALDYLERAGLELLARNYTCRFGELDLVMRDGATLVFVEVRYRRTAGFGDGVESVGAGKRAKLIRAAAVFLQSRPALANRACRFDVLALAGAAGPSAVDWRRNAFEIC